jgi:hypothetical protein
MDESKNFIFSEKIDRKYGDRPDASMIREDGRAQTSPSIVETLKDCLLHFMVEISIDKANPMIDSIPYTMPAIRKSFILA